MQICSNLNNYASLYTIMHIIRSYAQIYSKCVITYFMLIHLHLCNLFNFVDIYSHSSTFVQFMRCHANYATYTQLFNLGIVFTCTHNYASGADLGKLCKSACYTNYTFYPHFCYYTNWFQLILIDAIFHITLL